MNNSEQNKNATQDGVSPMQMALSNFATNENLMTELFSKTDYYWRIRVKGERRCKPFYQLIAGLNRFMPIARQRLQNEKRNQDDLAERLAKMESSDSEYKGLQVDLQNSVKICNNIESNILPAAENRLATAKKDLLAALNAFVAEARNEVDEVINQLLKDCLSEREAFLIAAATLYKDSGLTFVASDEAKYCPGPWDAKTVEELKLRLGMAVEPTEIKPAEPPTPAVPIAEPFGEPEESA